MVYHFDEFDFPVSSCDCKTEFPSANFVTSFPANAHPKSNSPGSFGRYFEIPK